TYRRLEALEYLKVPDRLATFDFQTCSRQPRSETAWLPASWRNFASQFKPRSQKWQLRDQSQQWPNTVQQLFLLNQHRLRQSIQLSRHHPAETIHSLPTHRTQRYVQKFAFLFRSWRCYFLLIFVRPLC
ncbi:hypothetical protein K443DRAFT_301750, partial [Laccaria amethystina LaAM-08-1]